VLIYRRTEIPRAAYDDPMFHEKRAQYEAVKRFLARFQAPDGSLSGGLNKYESPADFAQVFERHLDPNVAKNSGRWG
jgi:hypothetical protein